MKLLTLNDVDAVALVPPADDALAEALDPLGVPVTETSCPTCASMPLVLPVSCQVLPD